MNCTSYMSEECPIHGNCSCKFFINENYDCSLHGNSSKHAIEELNEKKEQIITSSKNQNVDLDIKQIDMLARYILVKNNKSKNVVTL